MAGGLDFDVRVEGADRVAAALHRAQPILKEDTVPVMQQAAEAIASAAISRATPHPSGLWRRGKRSVASPNYRTTKKGEYWFQVQTPGTIAGRAEAISEFAHGAVTSQGAALIRELDSLYGRPGGSGGGRILWAAADERTDSLVNAIESATVLAARHIEEEMGAA